MTNNEAIAVPTMPARARRVVALSILLVALITLALWIFENFSWPPFFQRLTWFHVDEVKISSEWPLAPSQIRSWLPKLEGRSILAVKGKEIVRELSAKPWVDWVTVKREFPNRVTLEVGTRRAMALEVVRNRAFFVDAKGDRIEKASPALLAALDLPVITREREAQWRLSDVMSVIDRFQKGLNSRYTISQVVLGSFPYFKVFLAQPRLEVSFSFENWDTQLPILALLLHSPPRQIGQPRKINLILSKKAVVSSTL